MLTRDLLETQVIRIFALWEAGICKQPPHSHSPYPNLSPPGRPRVAPALLCRSAFITESQTPLSIIKECPVIFIREVAGYCCRLLNFSFLWLIFMHEEHPAPGQVSGLHQSLQAASTSGYVRVADKLEDQWLVPAAASAAIEKLIWGSP